MYTFGLREKDYEEQKIRLENMGAEVFKVCCLGIRICADRRKFFYSRFFFFLGAFRLEEVGWSPSMAQDSWSVTQC